MIPVPKRVLVTGILTVSGILITTYVVLFLLPRVFAELRYPLAYEALIREEAAAHDLDPFLVAAVIHTESRFNPEATSHVGARGLMQIMPLTGAGIARRMGMASFDINQLYDPATNVNFGTFHLQGLMGRYNSDLEPAIVAYNGGGGAGDNYRAGNRGSVPTESLNYVKKVLAAKQVYEELYQLELSGENPFERREPGTTLANQILTVIQQTIEQRLDQ